MNSNYKILQTGILILFLTALSTLIYAQDYQMEVEGNTKITGRIIFGSDNQNDVDSTNTISGAKAGESIRMVFNSTGNPTFGIFNTFIGYRAGELTSFANRNTFVGGVTGAQNTTGNINTFIGHRAGRSNTVGFGNTSLGYQAGQDNIIGDNNIFIGIRAGDNSQKGTRSIFIGERSGVPHIVDSVDASIAIGYNALVDCGHCAVIGGIAEDVVNVGLNTREPLWRMHINIDSNAINVDKIKAEHLGLVLAKNDDDNNEAIGLGFQSSAIGSDVGAAIIHERRGDRSEGALHFATKNDIGIGGNELPINMTLDEQGRLGIGEMNPAEKLHIKDGNIAFGTFEKLLDGGSFVIFSNSHFSPEDDDKRDLGSTTNRWRRVYAVDGMINTSDIRLKKNVKNLETTLQKVLQLRPIRFQWKAEKDGYQKIGFSAQDLQQLFPEV